MIPNEWMPAVPMVRIHWHWTAGNLVPSDGDRRAYHFLIDGSGAVVRGVPSIAANSGALKAGYAAHTRAANTGAIGVAVCGMAGAVESPFNAGRAPINAEQIETLIAVSRVLGQRYRIPVSRRTMLSHAEVQPTLGIAQSGKWDFTRLPSLPDLRGAHAIGDYLRARIGETVPMTEPAPPLPPQPAAPLPVPAGAKGVVNAPSTLNVRREPNVNSERIGGLPNGTRIEIIGAQAPWLQMRSPAGHVGWVHGTYVDIVDGPPATEPTTPSPLRAAAQRLRDLADELEASIA